MGSFKIISFSRCGNSLYNFRCILSVEKTSDHEFIFLTFKFRCFCQWRNIWLFLTHRLKTNQREIYFIGSALQILMGNKNIGLMKQALQSKASSITTNQRRCLQFDWLALKIEFTFPLMFWFALHRLIKIRLTKEVCCDCFAFRNSQRYVFLSFLCFQWFD